MSYLPINNTSVKQNIVQSYTVSSSSQYPSPSLPHISILSQADAGLAVLLPATLVSLIDTAQLDSAQVEANDNADTYIDVGIPNGLVSVSIGGFC